MKITLKTKNNVYEQIVSEYIRYIELGIIKKDDKLPSCRTLGKELGINPNTVQRAYTVLEEQGYILSLPKKGAYVIYSKDETIKSDKYIEIKKYLENIKDEISYEDITNLINNIWKESKWLKYKV